MGRLDVQHGATFYLRVVNLLVELVYHEQRETHFIIAVYYESTSTTQHTCTFHHH